MGQAVSTTCCCCLTDRRASQVQNEALQEKLLDENESTDVTNRTEDPVDQSHEESNAMAMMALTDGRDDAQRYSRDVMDEQEDDDDDEGRKKRTGSSVEEAHAWNLSAETQLGFDDASMRSLKGHDTSERSLQGSSNELLRSERVESNVSVRSEADDSYASSQEAEHEPRQSMGSSSQDSAAVRPTTARLSSSHVFEDDDSIQGRGGFGSYESDSSSMRSFLVSDDSIVIMETRQGGDDTASAPAEEGEATKNSGNKKKKKGKKSPHHKRR